MTEIELSIWKVIEMKLDKIRHCACVV